MKFKVILIDCPWKYNNFSKSANGAPQYPTMTFEELRDLPIQTWTDKNCLMASWCTWPMLPQGIKLIEHWGFEYITGCPWIKTLPKSETIRCGTGFWMQATSEPLILARKGKVSPPKKEKRRGLLIGNDRQFYGPINKHSDKPEDIPTWLENHFEGPYLELFARKSRPNWISWGIDTGYLLTKNGVEIISK